LVNFKKFVLEGTELKPMKNIFINFFNNKFFNRKSQAVPLTKNRIHQILFYQEVINKVKHLDGCVVECGVGWGRSALMIGEIMHLHNKKKNFYLFDTFKGFPKLSNKDKEITFVHEGYYNAPKKYVIKFFENSLVSQDINFIFKEGDIKNTLVDFNEKISLLHLDLDIHSSYDFALEKLKNKVEIGGAIIIDEYNSKRFSNIKKLIDDHLDDFSYEKFNSNYKYFNRTYFIKKNN